MVPTPGVCASSLAVMRSPDRAVRIVQPQGDGGNSASLPEESTKEAVKTIRAGKAGMFRRHLWSTPCEFHLHAGLSVPAGARSSLRPLFEEGERTKQSSGKPRRENANVCRVDKNETKQLSCPAQRGEERCNASGT